MSGARPSRRARAGPLAPIAALLLVLAAVAVAILLPAAPARAAAVNYPTLTGHIEGPNIIGENLTATFPVFATGGPAFGFNGTQVGTLSFSASLTGTNTTGTNIVPTAGVFTNGEVNLSVKANNLTQTLVISVDVTSGHTGATNVSTNLTYRVQVVQPYTLAATLVVASSFGTLPFDVTVLLDGSPVGSVAIPSLTAHASYALKFSYVNPSLGPGWHTFSIDIGQEHGLVTFQGGAQQFSQSFYVQPATTNWSWVYVAAGVITVGAIFIFLTMVFGRRRGRRRSA
jgi:hypothetical protein